MEVGAGGGVIEFAKQAAELAAAASGGQHDPGKLVGGIYAANTAGAIIGALSFSLILVPAIGKTVEENETEFYRVLEQFKNEKVDDATLARVKTKARAGLIHQLDSNSGLASLLTSIYVSHGDWRRLFTSLDDLNKVTADDVQRVARDVIEKTGLNLAVIGPFDDPGRFERLLA